MYMNMLCHQNPFSISIQTIKVIKFKKTVDEFTPTDKMGRSKHIEVILSERWRLVLALRQI